MPLDTQHATRIIMSNNNNNHPGRPAHAGPADRRAAGRGAGAEDPGAVLAHLPRGGAARGRQGPLQEGPWSQQEHLVRHAGQPAGGLRHAAHRTGLPGGTLLYWIRIGQ